jgi:hypothetical protein
MTTRNFTSRPFALQRASLHGGGVSFEGWCGVRADKEWSLHLLFSMRTIGLRFVVCHSDHTHQGLISIQ